MSNWLLEKQGDHSSAITKFRHFPDSLWQQ